MTTTIRLAYATVLVASLLSLGWQPGYAEAPAHTEALLALAAWAGPGAADVATAPSPERTLSKPTGRSVAH